MKTIRGQKLAELGFKMTAEKCKKKFEDESGYFDNVSNYGKNNYRFLSELEELCQNPYSGGGDGDCDGDEGIVRSEKTLLHLGADNMGHRQCDGTDDKVVVEKSKERKRKRRDRFEMFKGFCESFVNKMMAQQEEIHNRLLKDMVKRDQEKFSKEEAWKKQEMERMNKELDIMAQEHAIAGDKHATIIEFLKSLGLELIPTETFWRPPWHQEKVKKPNDDHKKHGGATDHQRSDSTIAGTNANTDTSLASTNASTDPGSIGDAAETRRGDCDIESRTDLSRTV
ncbi:hypothetical protein LR48_Vigan03g107300 [Vigna angularis]|uniref:Uncharacterized protein n=1 Tax=Phaseolus angularis TaxID=3914 RepID=A0A0L9U4I6_PHAAN|nr:hypothetical protein LR48_Vigan03g107300 [Vigna angularis]